jgi:GNAT superfamily N-acetyltransferase
MKTFPRARTVVAFSGKQVMGWALIVVHNGKAYPNLFVNKRFRGRGISRVLVEHCLKYYPKVFIAKHDYITRKIFPTFEKLMPGKVYAYNWREVQSEFLSLIANLKT